MNIVLFRIAKIYYKITCVDQFKLIFDSVKIKKEVCIKEENVVCQSINLRQLKEPDANRELNLPWTCTLFYPVMQQDNINYVFLFLVDFITIS